MMVCLVAFPTTQWSCAFWPVAAIFARRSARPSVLHARHPQFTALAAPENAVTSTWPLTPQGHVVVIG